MLGIVAVRVERRIRIRFRFRLNGGVSGGDEEVNAHIAFVTPICLLLSFN